MKNGRSYPTKRLHGFDLEAGRRYLLPIFVLLTLTAGACSLVGPDYVRPEANLSSTWNTPFKDGVVERAADQDTLASWWTGFNDPVLQGLIDRAVTTNLDLKQARARVREARARRGIARAGLFPSVDATGAVTSSGAGRDASLSNTTDLFQISLDATWEIGLFGGRRRSLQAASADVQASEEDLRDVLVTLLSEVALNYIDVRTQQTRLALAESNVKSQEESWQLTKWRREAGLSDELAVEQARYNLEATRSQIPSLRTAIEEAMNRVAVLLGEQPGALRADLERAQLIPTVPQEIAVGIPADVLRQRPDVRKAERKLAAETARIGVATAELYPKLILGGSIGSETLTAGDLLTSASKVFSYGPRISVPVFRAGSITRNIEAQAAVQEQALFQYQAAVLAAVEDVENAIVAFGQEQQKRRSLAEASAAARLAATLAEQKYQAGLIDFTGVLDAQRSLFSYDDQMARSDGLVISNVVRLYKALGGGWSRIVPETTRSFYGYGERK